MTTKLYGISKNLDLNYRSYRKVFAALNIIAAIYRNVVAAPLLKVYQQRSATQIVFHVGSCQVFQVTKIFRVGSCRGADITRIFKVKIICRF